MIRILLCSSVLAACGGNKSKGTSATPPPSGPAPAVCPSVTFSCTDATTCIEGGDDLKAAMGGECEKDHGTVGTKCAPAGYLGSCTVMGKLTPTFSGCGTLWMKANERTKTTDDGKASCDKFGGTWTPAP